MFRINEKDNSITNLEERSLLDLGFDEEKNLQEWIRKNPSCLGEDLLIIQKEFSGWSGTRQALDLLALDKEGNLVIIETKSDDKSNDVTWQALRYASSCAPFSTENVFKIYQKYLEKNKQNIDARESISEFLEETEISEISLNQGFSQRIILVASDFRSEVTSTVLWLKNFKILIKCVKFTPLSIDEDKFLNFEQIMPVKDAQDYVLALEDKAERDTQLSPLKIVRRDFWAEVIDSMNEKSGLFQSVSPMSRSYISAGSGVSRVVYKFSISKNCLSAEVYIDRSEKSENKKIFNKFEEKKGEIEEKFGSSLLWDKLDTKKASRIKFEMNFDISDRKEWKNFVESITNSMCKIESAFYDPINELGNVLRSGQLRYDD